MGEPAAPTAAPDAGDLPDDDLPAADERHEPTGELRYGWVVSLLFWLSLLTSAGLYGLVSLAPSLEAQIELKRQEHLNQIHLLHLERQVRYLGQVVEALEHDPQFREELARVEFSADRPGFERLPVDPHLSLDARPARHQLVQDLDPAPWYVPYLVAFGQRGAARRNSVMFAAGLVIVAFTFLHESQARQLWGLICRLRGGVRNFLARYRKPPPPEEEEEEEEWEEVVLRRRVQPKHKDGKQKAG